MKDSIARPVLRSPDYAVVVQPEVMVATRDEVRLATGVYLLPVASGRRAAAALGFRSQPGASGCRLTILPDAADTGRFITASSCTVSPV